MDRLAAFLTSMVALSLGVERVVEILKGTFTGLRDDPDPMADPLGKKAARRRLYLHGISTVAGAGTVVAIGPNNFLPSMPAQNFQSVAFWASALLLGLMASGGSAFWNHALDIIGAVKSVKESVASTAARPVPAPPTGP